MQIWADNEYFIVPNLLGKLWWSRSSSLQTVACSFIWMNFSQIHLTPTALIWFFRQRSSDPDPFLNSDVMYLFILVILSPVSIVTAQQSSCSFCLILCFLSWNEQFYCFIVLAEPRDWGSCTMLCFMTNTERWLCRGHDSVKFNVVFSSFFDFSFTLLYVYVLYTKIWHTFDNILWEWREMKCFKDVADLTLYTNLMFPKTGFTVSNSALTFLVWLKVKYFSISILVWPQVKVVLRYYGLCFQLSLL